MQKEYTLPSKLKLIVDHLGATRALDEYMNGSGLKKDMQDLTIYLQQDLSRTILRPAGWKDLRASKGNLYSSPEGASPENALIQKWCVVADEAIAIEVCLAWPVRRTDTVPEPYVNLYVPPEWEKRAEFIAALKSTTPSGFRHTSQSDFELSEEISIFRDVSYTTHVGAEGAFDCASFLDAFRSAAKALVDIQHDIDRILMSLD
jgi:hypothetical protein